MGGGNVIAVKDNTLQRTTVRVSYSPTGEPILDSYYSGADFDRNGGIDGMDLASFFAAYGQGDETADLDQNGGPRLERAAPTSRSSSSGANPASWATTP